MSATSKNTRQKGFSYLLIKGSSVHFRISVPPLLRPIFGCTEFHRSLGTKLLREAKPIAAILGARLGMLFRDTVKRITRGEIVDIEKLNILVHDMMNSELGRIDRENIVLLQGATFVERMARRLQLEETYRSIMSYLDSERVVNEGLDIIKLACDANDKEEQSVSSKIVSLLGNKDISNLRASRDSKLVVPEGDSLYDILAPVRLERGSKLEFTDSHVDALEIARGLNVARGIAYKYSALKIDSGNKYSIDAAHEDLGRLYPVNESRPVQVSDVLSIDEVIECPEIDNAVSAYLEHCKDVNIRVTTIELYNSSLKMFVSFMGAGVLIDKINQTSIIEYEKCLRMLPAIRRGKLNDVPLKELVEMQEIAGLKKLEPSTQKNRLNQVGGFLTWAIKKYRRFKLEELQDARHEIDNAISRIEPLIPDGGARASFSDDDLKKIFHKDYYMYYADKDPALFWCPIISLFSGCRMEDILTVKRGEIKLTPDRPNGGKKVHVERNGIAYIDLTQVQRSPALKEPTSRRTVPIHPFVWNELGFSKFVSLFGNSTDDEKEVFIFEHHLNGEMDMNPKGILSDRFGAYCESLGIGSRGNLKDASGIVEKKSFHSFRNTVSTEWDKLDGIVPQAIIDTIIGHANKSSGIGKLYIDSKSITDKYDKGILRLNFQDRIPLIELSCSYFTKHRNSKFNRSRGGRRGGNAPWKKDMASLEGLFATGTE